MNMRMLAPALVLAAAPGGYPMLSTNCRVGFALLFFSISASVLAANTSDETAIRVAVIAFQEAWNHHDMKAMAGVFTEDADLNNVLGTRWQGISAQALGDLELVHQLGVCLIIRT